MNVGSLFSGIGGFDLGFERAGMRTVWFCEQAPYCQAVLAKHWPGVPCYDDVCTVTASTVEPVDVLCGGFPCQDLSYAGAGAGIDGARSGLWSEYARLIGELQPRYVVVENVPALLARGMGRVLGDLAALGYDAEWDCVPAQAVGAPHRRDRVWIVAYPARAGREARSGDGLRVESGPREGSVACADRAMGHTNGTGSQGHGGSVQHPGQRNTAATGRGSREAMADASLGRASVAWAQCGQWELEPDVGRVADGVPSRVDRLRALGNALVPQIAEWIGRRIMSYEHQDSRSER